ncbi:MAG: hypothetical protein AXA67_01725 [Methylothermaceae bacteria B42]|nr:MAG: hypothetical protein AXA67_01725 [Methylothermaceae bacteria B42]
MTSIPDRHRILKLVEEAESRGARRTKVCDLLGIHARTLSRWQDDTGKIKPDGRVEADRPTPANNLSEEERQRILAVCNLPQYAHLPPSQIVPALADEGIYIASESTFYRMLRETDQLHHRSLKYVPAFPLKLFEGLEDTRQWACFRSMVQRTASPQRSEVCYSGTKTSG